MKTTIEDLITRRSIRKYKPTQITQEELDTVLLAGTYAPTALNRQSPLLVAIQNKEIRDEISRLNGSVFPLERPGDPFYGAPTVIVVFADSTFKNGVKDVWGTCSMRPMPLVWDPAGSTGPTRCFKPTRGRP